MFSYDSGTITTVTVMPSFLKRYNLYSDTPAGYAIVPVSLAASFVASFVSGFVADGLGRKNFFYVASVIHEIGCVIEIAGQSQTTFFIGRILTGFAVGIYSMLVPLYQSEVARPQNRGRLITFYQIFVTMGFFIAFWVGYGAYKIDSDSAWRIPVALQLVAGFILLVGIYFIYESPRWLIYKDRNAEALKILAQLRSQGNERDVDVQMEFTGIVQDVTFDKMAYKQRFMSLLRKGIDNNRKRTLLGMGVHAFTQLSGINAILFYLPYILQSVGIREIVSTLLGNGVAGLINFVATIFVMFYIDKCDRRRILVVGALAMAVCMIAITIVSAIFNQQLLSMHNAPSVTSTEVTSAIDNQNAGYAIMVLLCIFLVFFAMSWGPVGWIYPAEIYPQMIRANAMGVTTSCSYLVNLFVSLVSPIMFRNIWWGTYLFFGVWCIIMAMVVHAYYPETRGRSLEEIQLIFSGALIDQRPDAHHPATAAEALIHLEQMRHQDTLAAAKHRSRSQFNFDLPEMMVVSSPRNVSRALNRRVSQVYPDNRSASHHSLASWPSGTRKEEDGHSSVSSIELTIKRSYTQNSAPELDRNSHSSIH
ncbi:uncharacterized protein B0P05DRAFT_523006 [Gilbertella persicaria]|uniref:uncharacterized protein n=1 Tax=Gilbertella persicaria TaxID=101096 RepID=UPI00221F6CC0|nr:uncharacterized protein B0P05DRAFT_523006 [Gilbertella persicaria]KAI8098019.1 hypothetical protein B0P05DRAFT_523006 [Gilbertella persicaria]